MLSLTLNLQLCVIMLLHQFVLILYSNTMGIILDLVLTLFHGKVQVLAVQFT